jgi:hypothetical protein
MTDLADHPAPTRMPRTPRPANTARGGVAQGSKIAAAGFGLTTMFGLVAAMSFASTTSASTSPAPATPVAPAPPAPVVVVIHPAAATTPAGAVAASPSQPIVLSAQPIVQQAPATQAAPAPAAQTNGSR